MESLDDAGVYKLTDDLAIIQTVDFFTPIVDNPYDFGQIAAANALSDVYAMGGKPLTAMNIVCFPTKKMDISVLKDILKGGIDKMMEAGVTLVGGHSIDDAELKYGLSVTGVVDPRNMVTNAGAQVGDKLILTKPLGTGIIGTALKAGKANKDLVARITKYMAALNKKASVLMREVGVHACTDITGFGFLGHTCQLAENSGIGIRVNSTAVPVFLEVEGFIKQSLIPGGLNRNRAFYGKKIEFSKQVPDYLRDVLFDPQTSGGLLISLDPEKADSLLSKLKKDGIKEAAVVGEIVSKRAVKIIVD
jgi:selenide, water dikinase